MLDLSFHPTVHWSLFLIAGCRETNKFGRMRGVRAFYKQEFIVVWI